MYIVWKDEFAIGVKIIDEQHKMLVDILNQLNELRKQKSTSTHEMADVFGKLSHYAHVHFTTEEEIMRIYNYADYQDHKKLHSEFTDRMNTLIESYKDQEFMPMDVVFKFIETWLLKHILVEDRKMGPCLKSQGLA